MSIASIAILLQLVMTLLGTAQANPNLTPEKRAEIVAFADVAIKTALEAIQNYKITENTTVGGTIAVEPNRTPILEPVQTILIPATSTAMPEIPVEIPKYTIKLLENKTNTPGLIFQVLDPQGNKEAIIPDNGTPNSGNRIKAYLLGQTLGVQINRQNNKELVENGIVYGPVFGSVKDNNQNLVVTDGKYTLHVETGSQVIETQVELSKELNTHYN